MPHQMLAQKRHQMLAQKRHQMLAQKRHQMLARHRKLAELAVQYDEQGRGSFSGNEKNWYG
jgi:vacuolar-type H+-ATPase subunit D/Vma8